MTTTHANLKRAARRERRCRRVNDVRTIYQRDAFVRWHVIFEKRTVRDVIFLFFSLSRSLSLSNEECLTENLSTVRTDKVGRYLAALLCSRAAGRHGEEHGRHETAGPLTSVANGVNRLREILADRLFEHVYSEVTANA